MTVPVAVLARFDPIWDEILDIIGAELPVAWEWIGGGLIVLEFHGEDPRRLVWIGTMADRDDDGPWVEPFPLAWVGGYAYIHDPDEDPFQSDRVELAVADPADPHVVATAIITAARQLLVAPCEGRP